MYQRLNDDALSSAFFEAEHRRILFLHGKHGIFEIVTKMFICMPMRGKINKKPESTNMFTKGKTKIITYISDPHSKSSKSQTKLKRDEKLIRCRII